MTAPAVSRASALLSEAVRLAFFPRTVPYRRADIPPAVRPPGSNTRLLVAPANYAGQGWAWAHAAERGGVGACNLEIVRSDRFRFPADHSVAEHVASVSPRWARQQLRALRSFTHVLVEAARPVAGRTFGGDILAEYAALRAAGLRVAYVCHGSEIRSPLRHAASDRWSPFRDPSWDIVAPLEEASGMNRGVLRRTGAMIFVSTPDLLEDVPEATWLPVVVDVARWVSERPALAGDGPPVVVHSPTSGPMKGSGAVDAVASRLAAEGVIDYRRLEGVPSEQMPQQLATADIVIDQLALGSYGVAACEAMAASRLVIGRVSAQVRRHVQDATGADVPIVDADPDTLEGVLREISRRPERHRARARAGADFTRQVHDGRLAADALAPFLRA